MIASPLFKLLCHIKRKDYDRVQKMTDLSELRHLGAAVNLGNGFYLKDYINEKTNERFCVFSEIIDKEQSFVTVMFEYRINPGHSKIHSILNVGKLKRNEDFWICHCIERGVVTKTVRDYKNNIHKNRAAWRINIQTKTFDRIENLNNIYLIFSWHDEPLFLK